MIRGKPIPIPVVASPLLGPGSQDEDETLDYMPMPQGMETYRPPRLPEPEDLAGQRGALRVLRAVLQAAEGGAPASVPLAGLSAAERTLVNQVLGEGEVSAQWLPTEGDVRSARVQESVFAGVWRVIGHDDAEAHGDEGALDHIEVGPFPELLRRAAELDGRNPPEVTVAPPEGVLNSHHVLAELAQHRAAWATGAADRGARPNEVVNLTLLPMSPADIAWMDHVLGTGRVLILSRGYGNCRITSTRTPHTWRVVYYNSEDRVILNTVEVGELPAVAQAAPEDLADTRERLAEVLQWVAQE